MSGTPRPAGSRPTGTPRIGPRAAVLAVAAAAVLSLVLAGCAGSGPDTATASTGPATTATTAVAFTVPSHPPTTTTTTFPHQDLVPPDSGAYASAFLEAWETGDRATAEVLGDAATVAAAFALPTGVTGTWVEDRCGVEVGTLYCTYHAADGRVLDLWVNHITASEGEAHAVRYFAIDD